MDTKFEEVAKAVKNQVESMHECQLFETAVDKDTLWDLYLDSFPEGSNPIYRERTEHDCSACRHFIKTFGGVVALKNGVVTSIWDFNELAGTRYGPVVKALSKYVHSRKIRDIFISDTTKIGVEKNYEDGEYGVHEWQHFFVEVPGKFKHPRGTLPHVRSEARSLRDVFLRSLNEISESSVETVLELIASNSLYRGEEWKSVLETFLGHLRDSKYLNSTYRELYAWEYSSQAGPVVGRIKNHSIGVLLMDISQGMDLDEAVRRYEKIVAPSNYKRPKPIFSQKMVDAAQKTVEDIGYLDSLPRRFAEIGDITVNNILFVDRDSVIKLSGNNVFDDLKKTVPQKFDRLDEVPLSVFVEEVLPTVQKVEILLENKHHPNMVSLIAPQNNESPSMFKWSNGFSWAYSGNMADSMKQRVKDFGGDVEGVLRFSIQWAHDDDLDAHCIEPTRNEIYYPNKGRRHPSSGMLDVDIIDPRSDGRVQDGVAVENITWADSQKMHVGDYQLFVHCYTHRGGQSGFSAEVEFDNQIYSFAYNQALRPNERVNVAKVNYNNGFAIEEQLPSNLSSKQLWGLETNQFYPVSVMMYSPNHWDDNGVGNRHVFFMVDGCTNDESPNGFFNEYLSNDLLQHKRVFEALGSKMRVEDTDNQLSGVGFSTTQRNELTVRVTGNVTRVLKVKI